MCASVSSWYFMDLWRILCFRVASITAQQAMILSRDVKVFQENLINFAKHSDERRKKNSWIDSIFCHKTFHIFQSSRDGGWLNCWCWEGERCGANHKSKGSKNWYKIKLSIKEEFTGTKSLMERWKVFFFSSSTRKGSKKKNEITIN